MTNSEIPGQAVPNTPEPATLAEALALIGDLDDELRRAKQRLVHARQELEDTNRGLIALYSELQEARLAEARLAAVVQASDDAILSMTTDCLIQTWNPGAVRLLGHLEPQIVGQHVECLMDGQSRELLTNALQPIRDGDYAQRYDTRWRRADGSLVDVAVTVFALRDDDGGLTGFSAVVRDITASLEAQRQLERLARVDTLTGLVNRAETLARLNAALHDLRSPGSQLGVLFCDMDRFKVINDTFGHGIGDVVLSTVAQRIHDCVRDRDTVGRMGGDEVLVVLTGVHSIDEAVQIAEKIRCHASQPIHYEGATINVTLSIGATLAFPGETESAMVARADAAMYQAKRSGRNRVTRI